jgi:hypothetical protein
MKTIAFSLSKTKTKKQTRKWRRASFGPPDVLFHLGSVLSRLCLRACSVHYTCAAFRNRQNLFSAFFPPFGAFHILPFAHRAM